MIGLGAGVGALGLGAAAVALARRGDASTAAVGEPDGAVHSAKPAEADGPADLAVAWWPQDLSLEQHGDDATLRFQSTIANIGGAPAQVRPGDRIEYTVMRQDTRGNIGEVVGRGWAPLDRGDREPFPVSEGTEIGHSIQTYGNHLEQFSTLAPLTASIVGATHPTQAITINGASEGLYVLRQQIVHADGSTDASSFDDTRLTELILDGKGGMLHASSRYDG